MARKELRGETQALKKSNAQYRTQIAELKRRLQALEQQVKRLGKVTAKVAPAAKEAPAAAGMRFSAKGFGAQRQRLGLSAAALGQNPGRVAAVGLQMGRRQGPPPRQTA